MSTAIVVAFHKYTPFGSEYYQPMLDFFVKTMKKYKDEYDKIYFIDSTWNIDIRDLEGLNAEIVKVNPHLRYYEAYQEVLPQIKEALVLFMDNDMVVYRKGIIGSTFKKLEEGYDVVSIYDTIGEKTFAQLDWKSKFCPYWFATGTAMLKDYLSVDWGSKMPKYETLGKLTEKMLAEGIRSFEQEEDKSNCLFDGTMDGKESKDLGYYHIRAGSTPAYLLATKMYGNKETYHDYIDNQPRQEYLRQMAWYWYMCDQTQQMNLDIMPILKDSGISIADWNWYMRIFEKYHGL